MWLLTTRWVQISLIVWFPTAQCVGQRQVPGTVSGRVLRPSEAIDAPQEIWVQEARAWFAQEVEKDPFAGAKPLQLPRFDWQLHLRTCRYKLWSFCNAGSWFCWHLPYPILEGGLIAYIPINFAVFGGNIFACQISRCWCQLAHWVLWQTEKLLESRVWTIIKFHALACASNWTDAMSTYSDM